MTAPDLRSARAWRGAARKSLAGAMLLSLAPLASLACDAADTAKQTTAAPAAQPGAAASAPGEVVATVGGAPITMADLETWIKNDLYERETADKNPSGLYDLRSDALDRMIADRLLEAEAKKRNVEVEALLADESAKAGAVTDDEVKAFYDENKARVGNQTLEQLAPRIREHLAQQARNDAAQAFVADLRKAAGVTVALSQPRVAVPAEGISRGPADAPVTIIEFSDYQCPFCRRAEPTVKEVLARYPDKVRFVYRHFPLEMHPRARPAAEAAECAGEQGRFWEYHEKVFAGSGFEESDFERYVVELGLDAEKWKSCRDEGRGKARVDADFAAGQTAGVTGTPAFFVNGIMISGARPVDAFTKLIDAELARLGDAAPESTTTN